MLSVLLQCMLEIAWAIIIQNAFNVAVWKQELNINFIWNYENNQRKMLKIREQQIKWNWMIKTYVVIKGFVSL